MSNNLFKKFLIPGSYWYWNVGKSESGGGDKTNVS